MKIETLDADSLYGATAAEWLRRWDSGDSVWSVEMGGLGPGYEQAIQIAAVAIVRTNLGKPLDDTEDALKEWGWDAIPKGLGLSGAQAGAARNLAYKMLKYGPAECVRQIKESGAEDRLIQVCKYFPEA